MEQEQQLALGERLIDELDHLRVHLNDLSDKLDASGVERTKGLRETMGRDCTFYRKSLDLFLRKDYRQLRNLCKGAHELFNKIEGLNPNG